MLPDPRLVRLLIVNRNYNFGSKSRLKTCATNLSKNTEIKLGNISITTTLPKHPELVPLNYMCKRAPQTVLQHLKWMMQKDKLRQDIFLIGPPGPFKRSLVMQYLELTKKEVEYISLSRDTTESDIKQRREIEDKTARYIDQCAVRAAVEGRVLVVEGIEKAERNVLPVLNNLLENREMQLEDGRFLMAPERYDKLLKEYSKEELDSWKLVRVSEHFRVIALGLPVPRYQGNPLDPPLRSRFQARDVNPLPIKEQTDLLMSSHRDLSPEKLSPILSFAYTMLTSESQSLNLPDFPTDHLNSLAKILRILPSVSPMSLLHRAYPFNTFLGKEGQIAVTDTMNRFGVDVKSKQTEDIALGDIELNLNATAKISFAHPREQTQTQVLAGTTPATSSDWFVSTNYHSNLLCQLMQSHLVKDFCVVGPKGCGKSALIKKFSSLLNYDLEPIVLYQDMTARDLVQQRSTNENGNTIWKDMPLVTACLEGKLAILDGLHRVNPGTLAVIHRLVHDRELQLFDGKRILRYDRYDKVKLEQNMTDEDMRARGILRMHPSFRIVALAEPPVVGSSTQQWLNPELLTLFLYHTMRPLSLVEETQVVSASNKVSDKMKAILEFTHRLRATEDLTLQSVATSLSVRQLLRISKRLKQYPKENASELIQKACLARFLPPLAKIALLKSLNEFDLKPDAKLFSEKEWDEAITTEVKDGIVRIGRVTTPVFNPTNKTNVPDVLFYDNAQHLSVMEDMLKDFILGEHLLLVGNQGVGKNKIVDRFLHLLNRPRQYIQLHRDTTVQTLTLQPTVRDGLIVYEDSPLVSAVKLGHVLVVDEADKAPTHVTCILKTLVESGEMILADGRRIVIGDDGRAQNPNIIQMHPNFRLVVLANRPGFPFLGNDFFGALGDIFSCHAVDNPSMESEIEMLKKYGPNVPTHTIQKLVEAFSELRSMADEGLISYPYSTREVVNLVKHMEAYPDEGLATVVKNVFDFDPYNKETWETLLQTLHKHGIPIGAKKTNVNLAKEFPLPQCKLVSTWEIRRNKSSTDELTVLSQKKKIQLKTPTFIRVENTRMDRENARSLIFTEENYRWSIPINDKNVVVDVAVTNNNDPLIDMIHIATANPISLHAMTAADRIIYSIDLQHLFHESRSGYRPQVRIAALGDQLNGHVIMHEAASNKLFMIDPVNGAVQQIKMESLLEFAGRQIAQRIQNLDKGFTRMSQQFAGQNLLIFHQFNGNSIETISMNNNDAFIHTLPFKIHSVSPISLDKWILVDNSRRKYLFKDPLKMLVDKSTAESQLYDISEIPRTVDISNINQSELNPSALSASLNQKISAPSRILVNPQDFASIVVGLPDLESNIEAYSFQREQVLHKDVHASSHFLTDSAQIVTPVPLEYNPERLPADIDRSLSGYIEVVDLLSRKVRYVPIPAAHSVPPFTSWLNDISPSNVLMYTMSNDNIVTVDAGGTVRLWETGTENIYRSLSEWRAMIGTESDKPIQLTIDQSTVGEVTDPKHGKEDPFNTPHVGGDTWAGGTGGRSTAGLGGIGGPYRLDAGHDVHQVSQAAKDAVPKEIREAARAMAQKAFKERLRQIQMSEYDAELYEKLSSNIQKQVQSMRVILDSLQAKSKERRWLRHQTSGELDDMKLIEGLTGEKAIYKRRGEHDPELGAPLEKPKRLKLVVDVSGSMYRFNGYDGRLQRVMEAALLVMEAFENYEEKFKYEIIGHSGETFHVSFVKDNLPANNKEKLDILKTMHAHAQFCMSGDNTLEATVHAINALAEEDADERFVIILSDANLDRYGIPPSTLARALTANSEVNAFALFIGSLGNQAQRLEKALPAGRGFVCMDTKLIPEILKQIFTSTLLAK